MKKIHYEISFEIQIQNTTPWTYIHRWTSENPSEKTTLAHACAVATESIMTLFAKLQMPSGKVSLRFLNGTYGYRDEDGTGLYILA